MTRASPHGHLDRAEPLGSPTRQRVTGHPTAASARGQDGGSIVRSGRLLRFAGLLGGPALLLAGSLVVAPGVAASGMTLYVSPSGASGGADTSCATAAYSKINDATSAAAAGGTVVVCAGTYKEDVAVAKAMTLTASG